MASFVNLSEINHLLDDGLLIRSNHPTYPLTILNYSARCQYDKIWNDTTLMCRGLVIHSETGEIIARPFKKFFNWEELSEIPAEPFELYEKLDGSFGIVFRYNNEWILASRGSFVSAQSVWGNKLLQTKYVRSLENKFGGSTLTFLVEIIVENNRIVVNYNGVEDLFGLGIINTETGEELPIELFNEIGMPTAKRYSNLTNLSFDKLKELISDDEEGFVVRFKSGFRMKIKGSEYLRLHRIVNNVSSKIIWEMLYNGDDINILLENVPDEFYNWVKSTIFDFNLAVEAMKVEYTEYFNNIEYTTRNEFAKIATNYTYPKILFTLLDGKSIDRIVWKIHKPEISERPFKQAE